MEYLRRFAVNAPALPPPPWAAPGTPPPQAGEEKDGHWPNYGIIGEAMMKDCALSNRADALRARELRLALQAADRANDEARNGPAWLRSGKFNPKPEPAEPFSTTR